MGWLSTLGKIGGIVGAPFSGGASLALTGLGTLGDVLGKQAAGSAAGRATESDLLTRQDMLRNQQYQTQQNAQMGAGQLDLQRKGFSEDARGGRAKQAMIGDLLSRLQDVNISVPGIQTANVTGGLRPSALGETGRGAGAELAKQALLKLMQGDTFEGGQVLNAPGLSQLPKAGTWEKIAGVGGTIGSLLGALGAIGQDEDSGGGRSGGATQPFNPPGLSGDWWKRIQTPSGFGG